jgi:hypothetical protein
MNRITLTGLSLLWLCVSVAYFSVADYPFTPDSCAYVAAAKSLGERGDLTVPFAPSRAEKLPVPYSAWPPGFPIAIAAASALGLDAWTAARLWGAAGVAAAVLFLIVLLRDSPDGRVAFAFAVISWPLAQFASRAWSEGPFVALVCGCLWAIDRWRAGPGRPMRYLALALACASAASLFRYSGAFLLVPLVWFAWRSELSISRFAGLSGCIVAALPLGMWLQRNAGLETGWRGAIPHAPAWWRPPAELCRAFGELSLAPPGVPAEIQAIVGGALAAGIALFITRGFRTAARTRWTEAGAVFAASFAAGLVISRALGLSGPLTPRLVWPVFMFAVLASWPAWQLAGSPAGRMRRLLLPLWIAAQSLAVTTAPLVYPSLELRLGERLLPPFVKEEPALLANRGWEVWRQTGSSVYYVPIYPHDERPLAADSLPRWAERRGVRYLVWYDEGGDARNQQMLYGELPRVIAGGGTPALIPVWRGDSVTVLEIVAGS